jgi:phosphoglycerate-specific signal transduction histidine kinase
MTADTLQLSLSEREVQDHQKLLSLQTFPQEIYAMPRKRVVAARGVQSGYQMSDRELLQYCTNNPEAQTANILVLSNCTRLVQVHQALLVLDQVQELDLSHCTGIEAKSLGALLASHRCVLPIASFSWTQHSIPPFIHVKWVIVCEPLRNQSW